MVNVVIGLVLAYLFVCYLKHRSDEKQRKWEEEHPDVNIPGPFSEY